ERRVDDRFRERAVVLFTQQRAERQSERGGRILRQRFELVLKVLARGVQMNYLDADHGHEDQDRNGRNELPAEGHGWLQAGFIFQSLDDGAPVPYLARRPGLATRLDPDLLVIEAVNRHQVGAL